MPAILGMLGGLLLSLVAGMVGRVLASLGLSVVTYYGISQALTYLKQVVMDNLSQLPVVTVQLLSVLKVGTGISILFSALFASMLLNGLNSDTFKKWIIT